MIFGFGAAAVAGFLLTAVPNWTGRPPIHGLPLASLALLWLAGRIAISFSTWIGAIGASVLDLAFPAVFLFVVMREIVAGGNWRNLPIAGVPLLFLVGNLLTHFESIAITETARSARDWASRRSCCSSR
ncbi:MAG: NnrS family protein [Alphaproteobacteria bacterium]|nr:NnrS family protein [Alphaproteobacteria bacterium]MBM3641130.1 NnrS family protein [Alphaproteobacteria bacterium]